MKRLRTNTSSCIHNQRRGATLLLVMIVATITTLLLASLLRLTSVERTANLRQILRSESRLAAESLANYAAAELVHTFETQPLHVLNNYPAQTLTLQQDIINQLAQGRIDTNSLSVSVVPDPAGLIPTYIDPKDPANQTDPLMGKIAFVRNFDIYAQASAQSGSHAIQSYAEMGMQVRDSPFFSYGIFYAMDLEFMPETGMELEMPIHSNDNFLVSCSDYIKFHENVTVAGKFLHGVKILNGDKHLGSLGDIYFKNLAGDFVPLLRDPNSSGTQFADWIDNHPDNAATWMDDSNAAFQGMLQDEAHGVPQITLAGFDPYVEGTDYYGADAENHAYAIIEPVLPKDHVNYKGDTVREQKFAMKSSLLFRITGNARQGVPFDYSTGTPDNNFAENTYSISAFKYQLGANGQPEIDPNTNKPIEIEVKLPAGLIGDANGAMDAIERDAGVEGFRNVVNRQYEDVQVPEYEQITVEKKVFIRDKLVGLQNLYNNKIADMANGTDNIAETLEIVEDWYQGAVESVEDLAEDEEDGEGFYTIEVKEFVLDANGNKIQARDNDSNLLYTTESVKKYNYGYNESGFTDFRHGGVNGHMDAVFLNVDRLRELINESPEGWNTDYDGRTDLASFDPDQDWNGVAYLELPFEESQRADNIVVAKDKSLGVMLINGEKLPTKANSNGPEGFTFATNGPVYVIGNYNADGDLSTGSAREYEDGEVPALIAADAITVFSEEFADKVPLATTAEELKDSWRPSGRRQHAYWSDTSYGTGSQYASKPVEISAALIAGITPSVPGRLDLQSGGVHNFIRLMQDWSPDDNDPTDFVYRGSIVSLFESLVHNKKISTDYENIYQPPDRFFGFNNLFREGRFPPGTPKGRTYRKNSLNYYSFDEYQDKISSIP